MFVDATFDIVPHPFYQYRIVMVFDEHHKIYIPVAWILMTGKTSECYWQAFNWLSSAVEGINPSYIGVDVECAFFSQAHNHFPQATHIGCLFHFIQAAWRKMIELKIPDGEVSFAMGKGIFDLITVIPKVYILLGIMFINDLSQERRETIYYVDDDSEKKVRESMCHWWVFWDVFFTK